ncbi:MAG: peptidoglycan DD-metalloendopeptidase family protein [Candidatus Kerfeldbacteria bacterium]|nr:peptidoglycan DD-metalloendopeptidase family protein [Candidatus Kerfeldbacteria bacterium]
MPIVRDRPANRGSITTRLTQFVLRITIALARFVNLIRKGVVAVLTTLILRPIQFIGRVVFRLSIPFYRLSFNARHRTTLTPAGVVKPTLLGRITGGYLVHIAIVVLTGVVAVGNLSARGAGLADIAAQSVLANVVNPQENSSDIIERAPAPKIAYVPRQNAISPDITAEAETGIETDADAAVAASGDALQIPLATTSDGVQQRSDVTTYVVQGGDTIGGIANRFAITQRTILAANSMSNGDFIKPGQELIIPPITGVLHKVTKGDTIASIATKYKVDAQEILDFNRLADASAISVDQTITVPGGEIPEAPRPVVATPAASRQAAAAPTFNGPIPAPAPAIGGGKLNWPTVRRGINQYFRYGHTGIDAECGYGDPLYAAREGTVSAVYYQRYGYGYHVIVDHGGSLQTLYGHASKIFVKPGQRVSRGATIAMCGSTGRSSGTHVHFETIVNGRKVNPLTYL